MRRQVRALGAAVLGVVAAFVASTPIRAAAPSAEEILARVTAGDAQLSSYTVPVHVDARLHRIIGMRFGLNGKVYFKRPDRVALEMRMVPEQYRRLFGELGTPLTWASSYDMSVRAAQTRDRGHGVGRLEGHAVLEYGNYELNEAVADSVFVAAGPAR